ncbi:MAG: hypothetical protein UY63_C0016G0019 [Parcubacteria group bacterium GW2011_GWA2_51_10]|nr:MAG: hypothetical protein UY63_C0016G0019 [Parcubacteria group bacterium GW2011_GWA2_51_10]
MVAWKAMTVLEKTLRWIVIAGFFALPFIVFIAPFPGPLKPLFDSQDYFFPYITGKNFAFRIIVEIITGAWLGLAFVRPEYRPRKSWILGAFAIFVAIIGLADALGVYPFKSFWSNFERMDGWITLVHLFALVLVASSMITQKLWRWYWRLIAGISVVVGLHALLQLFGKAALGQGGAGGLGARLDATFGNPIYLAVFMLFSVFIVALLWLEDWQTRPAGRRLPISILWGSALALDIAILFFTGTRGATLGFIAGAILASLLFIFFSRSDFEGAATLRKIAIGIIATILILAAGVWLSRDAQWVRSVGFLERLTSISLSECMHRNSGSIACTTSCSTGSSLADFWDFSRICQYLHLRSLPCGVIRIGLPCFPARPVKGRRETWERFL